MKTKKAYLKKNRVPLTASPRLHNLSLTVIALTGGIGTGKSTVSKELQKRGVFVICADTLVKEVYAKKETFPFIKKLVPEAIVDEAINFPLLREHAFKNTAIREELEKFIYPQMPPLFIAKVEQEKADYVVYDIPLLFEKKLEQQVDLKVLVYATKDQQIKRIMARDKCSHSMAATILGRQLPIEKKRALSDYIIENTGELSELEVNINNFFNFFFEYGH